MGRVATEKLRPFSNDHSASASSASCITTTQGQVLPGAFRVLVAGQPIARAILSASKVGHQFASELALAKGVAS